MSDKLNQPSFQNVGRISSKAFGKRQILFVGMLLGAVATASAQDLAVNGDLDVSGNVDIKGNSAGFGTRTDSTTIPGIYLQYIDGTTSSFQFRSSRALNQWQWLLNSSGTFKSQMTLGSNNSLIIYNQASTPVAGITLNPTGTSTFQQSVLFNGTDNRLANQTLTGNSSILTRSLADGRYAQKGTTVVLGSGTSTGNYSLSTGLNTTASGAYSLAGGNSSQALGSASVAFGNSAIAAVDSSFAVGNSVRADGGFASVAMGSGSLAEGYISQSIGHYNWTRGWYTTAFGSNTQAQGMLQFVAGQFNVPQGSLDQWVATDDLFILGNGESDTQRSNAFVIKKNGNVKIYGDVVVDKKTTLTQGGRVDGPLRISPQGDLSMGSFTQEP